jgi:ligand-binding sensor domain-containing protein/signal transduction histidine kinase
MLKNSWAGVIICLLLEGSAMMSRAAAGNISAADSPFIIDVWETGPGEQKLPQSSVISIIQTRDGYLWLGTLNGLVRFDGIRFTVFDVANTPGLDCNQIIHLFEDSRGNLWVGTETAGVLLVDRNGQISNLGLGRGHREQRLVSACEDTHGGVWLRTADGEVVRFRDRTPDRINVTARSVITEKSGPIWLGVDLADPGRQRIEQRLISVAAVSNSPAFAVERELPVDNLDYLLAARDGGFWVLADGRVQKWKNTGRELDWGAYPWNSMHAPVKAACEDQHGNLIVATLGEGVFWYDSTGHATQISTAQGLSHNFILSLCMDHEGDLWVGTDGGGLNRVKRRIFDIAGASSAWTIQSIAEDAQGGLWLGTFGSGLKYFKGGIFQPVGLQQGLSNLYIQSVFVDREQKVLAGAVSPDFRGLFQVSESWTPIPEMFNRSISAMYQDRQGRLWLGTQNGLVCRDGQHWQTFTTRDGLSSDSVRAITDDAEGNLWIGTDGGGLNRFRDGQFTVAGGTNQGSGQTISSLLMDPAGVLWIGTDGVGLARLERGKWTSYSQRDGLTSDSIGYLIEDGLGYLWMGSYAGLLRVPEKALNDFANGLTNSVPCRAFGKSDGLLTSECTQGSQPAACRTGDGKLWFPTTRGLVSLVPADLKINTNVTPVIIESVFVEGRKQNTNSFVPSFQTVTVPPGKERLEIYYTSLNFAAPQSVRFKYRLEGHESGWTDDDHGTRVARFSNLTPGEYRFHVIACNEDGIWNDTGAALSVIVLPPFWRTWWFLGINTAFVIGLLILVVRYLSTQKLQRQLATLRQQEALEKERARIARDLHDQLGANLTQVALLGELAETDRNLPVEVESHARQITQTARETTRSLDEIVWAANPLNDTLEGLITYACKNAQDYLALAGLRYRLEVPTQLPDVGVPPEVRHNVFLAFKEAVNNVVKHARATEAWIRLQLQNRSFTIEIQDNGRGIASPDEKTSRNGLRNMRKRMEDIGGSFSIGPGPEGGTLVRLTVPIKKE